MNHEQLKDDAMALADGQLRGDRRVAAESHVADCGECRTLIAAWAESSAWLKTARPAPSERFVSNVMSRVLAPEPVRGGWFADLAARWVAPVATGLAFAGFVALMAAPAAEPPASTRALLYSEVEDQLPATWIASSSSQERMTDSVSEDI